MRTNNKLLFCANKRPSLTAYNFATKLKVTLKPLEQLEIQIPSLFLITTEQEVNPGFPLDDLLVLIL